jgi:toxin ParE1/3/4
VPEFHLTVKALTDLKAVARYTQVRWGREQRIKYLKQLDLTFAKLAKDPRLGIDYDMVSRGYRGYRGYLKGSHIIFFRHKDENVEIIRILHQTMDIEARLED